MKIVIDTNVLISGLLFRSKNCKELINLVIKQDTLQCYVNNEILDEYNTKIAEKKDLKIADFSNENKQLFQNYLKKVILQPKHTSLSVCRDKKDDKFIECAVDNNCLFIVSGDKDLTDLNYYKKIKIVKVVDFLIEYQEIAKFKDNLLDIDDKGFKL